MRTANWLIAIGVTGVVLTSVLTQQRPATVRDVLACLLVVTSGLALAALRRAPIVVLVVTGVCVVGYTVAGFAVPALAFLVAVYGGFRAGHRAVTVGAGVGMLAALPLAFLASPAEPAVTEALAQARGVLELAWLVAAGFAGEALRQAERRADEAERTREETARLRATQERLHIARELHDSLTHQISIIKVQAEVAVHLARKRGEQVPEALVAIREAGRAATRELRATLDTLRQDGDAPPHGLDQLAELLAGVEGIGLRTELTIAGERADVPDAVGRTAYRIVQESLTNTARHAAASTASVRIDYRPDALAIRVDDDGAARPGVTPVPGIGLQGMRERVTALGGRLLAGPRSEGGFTVQAELPLERVG
ncbi:sensor histidine kinase [Actinoplanes xinjiangensis]|uniref:histidine kinase n=1 Tax=Actinoplanes xinjiangensis TaxID=512350 RepID=A0A316G1B5_9ACTN|nr:histidine kinase [Actinoplanes xinjiangensis]PWK48157.1 signal transduction histidine kinase [Actinoplanes xinjiangensis]GIF39089.1 two-component sensor histidine kinase [Actinoplanes xinjiangensis]